MTLEDVGIVGELIAAVATVATLAYLAIQIRANTAVSKAEARRANGSTASAVNLAIVTDGDVARIFSAGLADQSSLHPEELVRFSFLLGELIGNSARGYDEVSAGLISEQDFEEQNGAVLQFLETPGGRQFWEQFGQGFTQGFREYVQCRVLPQAPNQT